MLSLEAIRKSYKIGPTELEVLKGVDLTINEGEFISIVGASGSGKSTLMNILGLLDRPSTGTYKLGRRTVSKQSDSKLSALRNKMIGFVFQQFNLLPRLSALDNVSLPLVYRRLPTAKRHKLAMKQLELVGMAERHHHKPTELSGGQQQRVAIARALVGEPTLILADEPTGALDHATSADIMRLMTELNEQAGITIAIITHDHDVAAQCKRRLRMADGRLERDP